MKPQLQNLKIALICTFSLFLILGCEKQMNVDESSFNQIEDQQERVSKTGPSCEVNFIAAQNFDIGSITIEYLESDEAVITYFITEPDWYLNETHLDVQIDPVNFPQTKKGNPKVGHFAYGEELTGASTWDQTIDLTTVSGWEEGMTLYIAAHAEVISQSQEDESAWGEGESFPGNNWAMYFSCETPLPINGLIAYYPFNGNANDESGNGNDGTVYGATLTSDRFTVSNSAYSFDGNLNYISFQNQFFLHSPHDATISIWIYDEGDTGQRSILWSKLEQSDKNRFHLYTDDVINGVQMGFDYREENVSLHLICSTFMTKSAWHNLIVTREGNIYRSYLDNQFLNEFSDSNPNLPYSLGWILARDNPYGQRFKGKLDDIRIYNRALSEDEIQALYHENGYK